MPTFSENELTAAPQTFSEDELADKKNAPQTFSEDELSAPAKKPQIFSEDELLKSVKAAVKPISLTAEAVQRALSPKTFGEPAKKLADIASSPEMRESAVNTAKGTAASLIQQPVQAGQEALNLLTGGELRKQPQSARDPSVMNVVRQTLLANPEKQIAEQVPQIEAMYKARYGQGLPAAVKKDLFGVISDVAMAIGAVKGMKDMAVRPEEALAVAKGEEPGLKSPVEEFLKTQKPQIEAAVIPVNGKTYEGVSHLDAVEKARQAGEQVPPKGSQQEWDFKEKNGMFRVSGEKEPITRQEAGERFGVTHSGEVPKLKALQDQATGIRQKTLARQYGTMPGEGTTPEVQIQKGRDLIGKGTDPEAVMQNFEKSKTFNADSLNVARAHLEDLKKATRQATTPEAREAGFKAQQEWVKRLKPMATEWHKAGMAMQGETMPDTGSLVGIREAVIEKTGHDIKPAEIPQAKALATNVSGLDKQIQGLQQELFKMGDMLSLDPKKQGWFSQLPDAQKTIWKHAKDHYIDKGVGSFEDMLKGTAQDLGVSYKEVVDAIRAPKAAYKYTTEMYKLQSRRRAAVRNANSWIASRDATLLQKVWDTIYRIPFGLRVAWHAVGMETHAGSSAFIPEDWAIYWPKVLEQFKNLVSPEFHERAMQELVNRDYYWDAKRGGLAVDPDLEADNFQIYAKWLGKLGEGGARAMDTLKSFRYEMFERAWKQAAEEMRTPEYAKLLSQTINHATGVADSKYGAAMRWMFAPKLEMSRWVRLLGDPIKTVKYLTDPKATPAQRQIGKLMLRRTGEAAGVYLASLGLNYGLNKALGVKDEDNVNFIHPTKPNFLAHMIAGHRVDLTGGLMQPLRLIAHLAAIVAGPQPARGETRFNKASTAVTNYGRGKESPFLALLTDWAAQSDYEGRILPWSSDKPKLGKPKYTPAEYALEQGPIPMAGAIRELADVWHAQGMTVPQMSDWLSALAVFGAEGVGIKVGQSDKVSNVTNLKQAAEQGFKEGDVSLNERKKINKLSEDTDLNKFNAMSLAAKSDTLASASPEEVKKYWKPYIAQYQKTVLNPVASMKEKGRNELMKIISNHQKIRANLTQNQ